MASLRGISSPARTVPTPKGSLTIAVGKDRSITELPWLGPIAHENAVVVPGFPGKTVLMGLDDNNGASELYLYLAASPADVLAGKGKLYVFTTDEATHSGNLATGQTIKGAFQEITTWDHTKSAADLQDAVDNIGSHGALPFVRIEDADYDHRVGVTNQKPAIYFVDTGNGATTGRVAGKVNVTCNGLCDHFGSIYRVQFDPADPTRATLTLLARSRGVAAGDWASPDNVAAGKKSLMVQEDPAYPEASCSTCASPEPEDRGKSRGRAGRAASAPAATRP
jgi:secreted PhoX family phosphatase